MKKKQILFLLLTAVFAAFVISSCSSGKTYSLGTGDIGGNYYSYGNAFSQLVGIDNNKININIRTTAGSAANLRLIQQGFLDAAIAQSDTLQQAYNGEGQFEGIRCKGIRAVAGLYTEECQIIVRADSEISSVSDLYGKKVSVGEKESGVTENAEHILLVNGLTMDMIIAENLSFSDSAAALEKKEIDAFFCTAGSPTTAVTELSKTTDIKILSLDEKSVEKLLKNYPGYTRCVIPVSTYQGQTDEAVTIGVKAVLVAGNKVPDEIIYQFADTLFNHGAELRYSTSASELDTEFAVSEIPVPFHKGASEWYKNNNINVDSDSDGKTGSVHSHNQD